jgi:hypothetical protein
MFGRGKKVELIDDHFDDEELDDKPKKGSPNTTSLGGGVNKTTQSIIDMQNKMAQQVPNLVSLLI